MASFNTNYPKSDGQTQIALIGAGHRGRNIYGQHIKKNCPELEISAIVEPNPIKRKLAGREHKVPSHLQFKSYQQLFDYDADVDVVMITTMDHEHYQPAMASMSRDYKILLEKPITPNFEQLRDIVQKANRTESDMLIAHVLRYTPFYRKLKQLLVNGEIGKIRSIKHSENVGYYHFVHSYVRGNWKNETVSAPLFLAKSSHDFDLFTWLLDSNCKRVYAQGEQQYFISDNHPQGAGKRCFHCQVEHNCPYSARHIYLDKELPWPQDVIASMPPRYQRYLGVRFTNLGHCVYLCDNTMPEVLTASLEYENNVQVNFTLTGLSSEMNRLTTIYGDLGEIRADFAKGIITILPFRGKRETIQVDPGKGAHGGGDLGLMEHLRAFIQGECHQDTSTLEQSIESHVTALAAEESRISGEPVYLSKYWRELN